MSLDRFAFAVVGAGFWGSVMAERIAAELGEPVLVIEQRDHAGGNCHSQFDDATGIECHRYGTHIFHTTLPRVWDYVRRFSAFTPYRHKVLTQYRDRVYPMPISLATINQFFQLNLKPAEVADFIRGQAAGNSPETAANLEEKAVALIGEPLYRAFIQGYTHKQWQTDPKRLPADIIARLPVRPNYNTDYFNDPWQGMPEDGYAALFRRLLDHPRIELRLNTTFADVAESLSPRCRLLYTGPLDAWCDHALGRLAWRSLDFAWRTEPVTDWQGTSVMNYADVETPWTRIHEFKHLHPERPSFHAPATVLCTEYSKASGPDDIPYYPVNTPENTRLFEQYQELAAVRTSRFEHPVIFGGRLGLYRYFDMDKTIDNALTAFDTLRADWLAR